MSKSRSSTWGAMFLVALGASAVAAFALAEPPRADKRPIEPPGMHEGKGCPMHGGDCGKDCPMMHGMRGMHGMMGPDGPKDMPAADVAIEKTKNGAVIRIAAKNTADVAQVQRRALMIALHLGADPAALMPAAPEGKK